MLKCRSLVQALKAKSQQPAHKIINRKTAVAIRSAIINPEMSLQLRMFHAELLWGGHLKLMQQPTSDPGQMDAVEKFTSGARLIHSSYLVWFHYLIVRLVLFLDMADVFQIVMANSLQ